MKESSWEDCLEYSVVKTSPDPKRAESLIETSEERLGIIKEISEKNSNFVFEDYYTSIMELLQALVLKEGYKIPNHICLGFYLRDILKREDLFRLFDDLRYKKNSLAYYGKKMDFEISKQALESSKKLIKELKILLKSA
ncbi:MAG: hypothetical protein AABX65_04295 [Nanoarchaeota archaeon]